MLNNEAAAAVQLTAAAPQVATTTVTGPWIQIRGYEGTLLFQQIVGAVSGTTPNLAGKIQDADDNVGTNSADVSGATFTAVTAADQIGKVIVAKRAVRGWVRYVGTISGTTPSFALAAVLNARPRIV